MRLIDADALIEELEWLHYVVSDKTPVTEAIERVKTQPTIDATLVTRCKDCIHYKQFSYNTNTRHYCDYDDAVKFPSDFCSWAERRTE